MELSEYGNTGWYFFVYSCYGLVLFSILFYFFYVKKARDNSLRSLKEEGFLDDQETQ